MDSEKSDPTIAVSGEIPDEDAQVRTPTIEATDREYLVAGSEIPGSHYGLRIGTNAALWALALQRGEMGKQLYLLSTRHQQRLRSARLATISAVMIGILSTGGVAIYTRNSTQSSAPVAKLTVRKSEPLTAATVKPASPVIYKSVSDADDRPTITDKHDVTPNRVHKSIKRTAIQLPKTKEPAQSRPVKTSTWIAEPLEGEALRQALIIDRKRTKELNDAQLREQANRHLN